VNAVAEFTGEYDDSLNSESLNTQAGYPEPPSFDPKEYLSDLEDCDMTEEQKAKFLQTMWNIMSSFVDVAWGVDPVQCIFPDFAKLYADMPQEGSEAQQEFNLAAKGKP
jgi:hypothetical protein